MRARTIHVSVGSAPDRSGSSSSAGIQGLGHLLTIGPPWVIFVSFVSSCSAVSPSTRGTCLEIRRRAPETVSMTICPLTCRVT